MGVRLLRYCGIPFPAIAGSLTGIQALAGGIPAGAIRKAAVRLSACLFLFAFILFAIPGLQGILVGTGSPGSSPRASRADVSTGTEKAELEMMVQKLERKYQGLTTRTPYLVINTSANRFYLYENRKLTREGVCSTGSYILLVDGKRTRWLFKTPKGRFSIQGKTSSPVWKKPDWAFVELGMPVPPPYHPSRYEYGVLGEYALSLGQGYLIHGTLYKRFLGLPVTHGCIRLDDEDLETVYRNLCIGSRVYIY